jgi:cell division initiation protein
MITPLDLENKKFNRKMMNGYNVEEVDEFLDELLEDYGKNYKELSKANAKIEELTNSLSHYKNIETTLQNTLVMAQTTAEEVKNVAKQQSDQIISEAQKQSEEIVRMSKENSRKALNDLEQQIKIKEKDLDDLKKQFDIYKAKMESLLISQLELIKEINKEDE